MTIINRIYKPIQTFDINVFFIFNLECKNQLIEFCKNSGILLLMMMKITHQI